MSRSREQLLNQLTKIKEEALGNDNPWGLGYFERGDISTTIDTLIFIVKEIDVLKLKNELYFHWGIAPIHMENYHQAQFKFKIEVDKMLFHSLVEPFIDNYIMLKMKGHEYLKNYLSRFSGYCIDGRVSNAFEYASQFEHGENFTSSIAYCKSKLPTLLVQSSYAWLLGAIIKERWELPYRADTGKNAYIKAGGVFDLSSAPIIDNYLREVLLLQPSLDFLLAHEFVPENSLNIYFSLLFKQPEFIQRQLFPAKQTLEEKPANVAIAHKIKGYQFFKTQLINEFMTIHYYRLLQLTAANEIQPTIVEQLSRHTTLAVLLDLWKKPLFFEILEKLTPEQSTVIIASILQIVQNHPAQIQRLITTPLHGKNTLLHLASRTNDPVLVAAVIALHQQQNLSLWEVNDNQESAVVIAAKHKFVKITPLFLQEEKNLDEIDKQKTECSKALLYLAHQGVFDAINPFLQARIPTHYFHPDTHYSIVHYSIVKNHSPLLEDLLEAKADINQVDPREPDGETAFIAAVKNTSVTIDTLAYLITKPDIDLNKKAKGESALFIAAKTNQFDKLFTLLCLPNIDTVAARLPGDGMTALDIAKAKKHWQTINILTLYQIITDLLDNKIATLENTSVLHLSATEVTDNLNNERALVKAQRIQKLDEAILQLTKKRASDKAQMIQDLYEAILRKRDDANDVKQRVQYILNESIRHILQVEPATPCDLAVSFTNAAYATTTATLNQFFCFIGASSEPDVRDWQQSLRTSGLHQLEADLQNEVDTEQKRALLTNARKQPIFSGHRHGIFQLGFGRTEAQKAIDRWLAELSPQAPSPKST